jgi:hypothetical protein
MFQGVHGSSAAAQQGQGQASTSRCRPRRASLQTAWPRARPPRWTASPRHHHHHQRCRRRHCLLGHAHTTPKQASARKETCQPSLRALPPLFCAPAHPYNRVSDTGTCVRASARSYYACVRTECVCMRQRVGHTQWERTISQTGGDDWPAVPPFRQPQRHYCHRHHRHRHHHCCRYCSRRRAGRRRWPRARAAVARCPPHRSAPQSGGQSSLQPKHTPIMPAHISQHSATAGQAQPARTLPCLSTTARACDRNASASARWVPSLESTARTVSINRVGVGTQRQQCRRARRLPIQRRIVNQPPLAAVRLPRRGPTSAANATGTAAHRGVCEGRQHVGGGWRGRSCQHLPQQRAQSLDVAFLHRHNQPAPAHLLCGR